MKINQLPNFRLEDYPTAERSWLGKFFVQLNPFVQSVNTVFDQNVDYSTNIKSLTTDYAFKSGFQSFSLLWPFPQVAPADLRIMKSTKTDQKTPCILIASWSYDSSTYSITINNMIELSSSGVSALSGIYNFTLRATV